MFRASKFAFVDTLVAIISDVKIFLAFLFLTLVVRADGVCQIGYDREGLLA